MNEPVFGKLEKVDPKTVWETLADDFTPWLAQEYSLAQLGEALGIELEHQSEEGAARKRSSKSLPGARSC